MKNKLLISLFLILVLQSLACQATTFYGPRTILGSGVLTREQRTLPEFSSVEIAGAVDVILIIGPEQSVVIQGDDNILPVIVTSVSGKNLVITQKAFTSITPTQPLRVIVTVKKLTAARITGSGNLTLNGLVAEAIQLDLRGSGNIIATGVVGQETVNLTGSGNVMCGSLAAKSVKVNLSGSGNVDVFASSSIAAVISGSGEVKYRGKPQHVEQNIPGSGNISPME